MNGITITKKDNIVSTVDGICSVSVNTPSISGKFLIYLSVPNDIVENNLVKIYISEIYADDYIFEGTCDFSEETWIGFKPILLEIINGENISGYSFERIVGQNFKVSNPRKPATAISEEKLNKIKEAQKNSGVDVIEKDLTETPAFEEVAVNSIENTDDETPAFIENPENDIVNEIPDLNKEVAIEEENNVIEPTTLDNNNETQVDVSSVENNDTKSINTEESEEPFNINEEDIQLEDNNISNEVNENQVLNTIVSDGINDSNDYINNVLNANLQLDEKVEEEPKQENIKEINFDQNNNQIESTLVDISRAISNLNENLQKIAEKIEENNNSIEKMIVKIQTSEKNNELESINVLKEQIDKLEIELEKIKNTQTNSQLSNNQIEINVNPEEEEYTNDISTIPEELPVDIEEKVIDSSKMSIDDLMNNTIDESVIQQDEETIENENSTGDEYIIQQNIEVPTDGTNFLNPFNIDEE